MTVYLVGAGPGDPELLSVRGARLLRSADVVLHDRLARALLGLAKAGAEVIDVGKAPGSAPVPQEEINRLLIEHGRRRRCVVRLKGGDPFVFARGAEEAMALKAAGIAFEIIPGISSVVAAPAAAGVPLTCRGVARSFTVLTGQEDPDRWPPGYAEALASLAGTIVVVMATTHISRIARPPRRSGPRPTDPSRCRASRYHFGTSGSPRHARGDRKRSARPAVALRHRRRRRPGPATRPAGRLSWPQAVAARPRS